MPTTCANADQPGLIRFPIGIGQSGSRYGRRITISNGYPSSLEIDCTRSSLFGSLKRDDRDNWRNNLVLLAFSAPIRREKPRNSMRTGTLAADCEQPDCLNRAPEYWKRFEMLRTKDLAAVSGGPDCLGGVRYIVHRTGIAIHKSSQSHCKL